MSETRLEDERIQRMLESARWRRNVHGDWDASRVPNVDMVLLLEELQRLRKAAPAPPPPPPSAMDARTYLAGQALPHILKRRQEIADDELARALGVSLTDEGVAKAVVRVADSVLAALRGED